MYGLQSWIHSVLLPLAVAHHVAPQCATATEKGGGRGTLTEEGILVAATCGPRPRELEFSLVHMKATSVIPRTSLDP